MKYKINDDYKKPALRKRVLDKHDWLLFYCDFLYDFTLVKGLVRTVPTDRKHANCMNLEGRTKVYLRHEYLTFQSRKAAYRYIVRHAKEIREDYRSRNGGRDCNYAMAIKWKDSRQKQVIVDLRKLYNKNNNGKRSNN